MSLASAMAVVHLIDAGRRRVRPRLQGPEGTRLISRLSPAALRSSQLGIQPLQASRYVSDTSGVAIGALFDPDGWNPRYIDLGSLRQAGQLRRASPEDAKSLA
jgi:hypothetical protein